MKKIVVIGGGTAGWITALFARHMISGDITVISPSNIDILGAGEGSTPNLTTTLKNFKIDLEDFINKTGASLKSGITFENWNPSLGSSFEHLFNLDGGDRHGLHFDARKTANYLEEHSIKLGIKKIDKVVRDYKHDDLGNIVSIIMEDNTNLECDFIFDCSGFQRLVIGKHYKSEWISYSDKLLCNKAFGFFLPQINKITSKIVTKTKSIAMKYGWMWEIPLQTRYGCGYTFSDEFTTVEEAKKEVEDYLGREIEIVRVFDFNPGSFKETWINNSVAIGLASGFVEPLEATSLMGVISSLEKLIKYDIFNPQREDFDEYNTFVSSTNTQIVSFLMHHYNCDRADTPFWQKIKTIELPEIVKTLREEKTITNREIKKFFNITKDNLVFGEKNFITVDGGHEYKKIKKTLI